MFVPPPETLRPPALRSPLFLSSPLTPPSPLSREGSHAVSYAPRPSLASHDADGHTAPRRAPAATPPERPQPHPSVLHNTLLLHGTCPRYVHVLTRNDNVTEGKYPGTM